MDQNNNVFVISNSTNCYSFSKSRATLIVKAPISSLTINGQNNNIIFQHEILNLVINGSGNKINASHRKCLLTNIVFNGSKNRIEVNQNSSNVCYIQNGGSNKIYLSDNPNVQVGTNGNSFNTSSNTFNFGNPNISINFNGGNVNPNINPSQIMDFINNITSGLNMNFDMSGFTNQNTQNYNNYNGNSERNFNTEEDSGSEEDGEEEDDEEEEGEQEDYESFDRKKQKFILELDEFQYKHLEKFSALKEEKCAICLSKFKGSDIIKEFPCKHIFHKECILKWLKKNNCCPLCKHDISEDIKNMKINMSSEEEN